MKGFLLDTNVVLISVDREHPSQKIRDAVLKGPNYVSVVSYWEVVLKCMKGKLDVGDPRVWWRDALQELAAETIQLRSQDIEKLYSLQPFHQDPFDRILISQAIAEGLTLVTTDRQILRYASREFSTLS